MLDDDPGQGCNQFQIRPVFGQLYLQSIRFRNECFVESVRYVFDDDGWPGYEEPAVDVKSQ
jgi:hypothetical protein